MASESNPPSDKEMNTYGFMYAATTFGLSILSTALFVVHIVLVLYGVSGFFSTPKERRKGRLRFIIISCLMMVMCAIDIVASDLWEYFLILYAGGPDGLSYLQTMSDQRENWLWVTIGDILFTTAIVLGDILMLWRCLVLWTDRKWVVIFPSLVCLGSITSNITWIVSDVTSDVDLRSNTLLTSYILRVAMNVMITFLIVLRVMRVRARTAKAFPHQEPPRWYLGVTALVVESAAPLAIFGLESGYMLKRARRSTFGNAVACFYDAFCTLSPQMIIVRVTRGKAWDSCAVEATDREANISQPIQFAHSTKETTPSNTSASV
ncbi:hypothetical protein BKA70DRAFT_1563040 [Coprinopsis sp. MPI-PUGE-AT-0042]|nr:hypothetical protein BKA70DRAFT_1563040 [Coprinopsis sp. MPI-PUGE-AT-0042]